jgi:recombination protein RecA
MTMTESNERRNTPETDPSLERALAQIRKQYGPGAIMRLGERQAVSRVPAIPTGALTLDLALGIGGVPRGRITELYGSEGSGKTTLALHLVAGAQRQGGLAAYIDAEHALDTAYAGTIGVDTDSLFVAQPDHGEEALQVAETLIRSGRFGIIVVDSVAALVPKSELEGQVGDPFIGLQARLMSQALRKFAGLVDRAGTAIVFVNQIRERVGVMFGPSETTSGGRALRFYASVRLEVRRTETLKDGDRPIGQRVRAKVVKNKLAPPFREADFEILFGHGIRSSASIVDGALAAGVLSRNGSWISLGGRQVAQGRDGAIAAVEADPSLAAELERRARSAAAA